MKLLGIHHITAYTKDIQQCYDFYHHILGMKLIKQTVDHQTPSVPHLYFGDKKGQPGTALSFVEGDFKDGNDDIFAYSLRVPTDRSLYAYKLRFDDYNVKHDAVIQLNGRHALPFYDCDNRLVYLVSDETNTGVLAGTPDDASPVESIHQIYGIGPVLITVQHSLIAASVLHQILKLERTGEYAHTASQEPVQVFTMATGGNGGEIHLLQQNTEKAEHAGIHHAAFRIDDIEAAEQMLDKAEIQHSGIVDSQYFKSLYFRDISGVLFELATDEPGFTVDEDIDALGQSLSLPEQLESRRQEITDRLKSIRKDAL